MPLLDSELLLQDAGGVRDLGRGRQPGIADQFWNTSPAKTKTTLRYPVQYVRRVHHNFHVDSGTPNLPLGRNSLV
jgi:hypothetical protein